MDLRVIWSQKSDTLTEFVHVVFFLNCTCLVGSEVIYRKFTWSVLCLFTGLFILVHVCCPIDYVYICPKQWRLAVDLSKSNSIASGAISFSLLQF